MPSIVNELIMKEITTHLEKSPYAFISHFQGLSVADISDLRRNLEKVSKRSMVMKHALAKKALSSLQFSEAGEFLKNNVLVTIADKEPQIVSKALVDFAKTNAKLVTAGVIFEKKVYGQAYVKALAQLPSRHELLTQVVVRIKSPITGFVMTLGQLIRGLVVTLNEVKKQKEAVVASA